MASAHGSGEGAYRVGRAGLASKPSGACSSFPGSDGMGAFEGDKPVTIPSLREDERCPEKLQDRRPPFSNGGYGPRLPG